MNVAKRFLDDAEDCCFDVSREPADILGNFGVRLDAAAAAEAFRIPAQRRL